MPNKKSHTSTASFLTLLSLVSYALIYGLELWIAHLLGPASYGHVKIKIRIVHNLVHLLVLGQDGIILIYIERYREQPQKLKQFISWLIRSIRARMLLVWAACLLAHVSYLHGYPGLSRDWALWLCVAPSIVVLTVIDRWFLSLKKYYQSFFPRNIWHPVLCAVALYAIPKHTEGTVLWIYGGSMILMCLERLYAARVYVHELDTSEGRADPEWWRSAGYYLSSVLVVQTSRSFNLYLLDYFGRDPKEIGYFSSMLTIAFALYVFTKPIENFLKPWISTHSADPSRLKPIIIQCNRLRFALVAIILGGVWMYAEILMGQFGPEYIPYAPALRYLILCYSLYTLGQLNLDLLNFGGDPHLSSGIMLGKLVVMCILAIALIPTYGLWGCLIADGATSVASVLVATVYAKKRRGIHGWSLF